MALTTSKGAAGFYTGNLIKRGVLIACAALVITLPMSAAGRFRGGYGYGPRFDSFGYGYGFGPTYYGGYPGSAHPDAGQIKLDTKVKDAAIYINGAYTGISKDLKSMWLRQGAYTLEIRSPGREPVTERVYVLMGKTVHIRPSDF